MTKEHRNTQVHVAVRMQKEQGRNREPALTTGSGREEILKTRHLQKRYFEFYALESPD